MRRLIPLLLSLLVSTGCESKTDSPEAPAPAGPKVAKKGADPTAAPAKAEAVAAAPASTGQTAAVLADVPESSTVFAVGVEGLDAMVQLLDRIVAMIPAEARADAPAELVDPAVRSKTLGADLATTDGWRALGIDPAGGAAVALDANLADGPVLYLRITDRTVLLAKLKALGAKIEAQTAAAGATDGVETYLIDGKTAWVGSRGQTTVVMVHEGDAPAAEVLAKFKALLADKGPSLGADKVAQRTFRDLGQGARYWSFAKPERVFGFLAHKGEVFPHADFVSKRVLGLGIAAGPGTGGLRLLTDDKAAAALAKIFRPSRPTAQFSRYFAAEGMVGMRFTVNIAEMFDGVADLIPPEESAARGQVMIAKNAVPVAIGVQIADLAKAFSGHIAVVLDFAKSVQGQAQGVVLIDVLDPVAADALLEKLVARAKQTMKMPAEPVEVAGLKGFKVGMGEAQGVIVRQGNTIIAGKQPLVEAALAVKAPATGALAAAIDGDYFYGFMVDLGGIAKGLPPEAKFDPKLAEAVFGAGVVDGHVIGGFRHDAEGITTASGQSSALLIGVLAAVAIPAFVKYMNRSKASEARVMVRRLADLVTMAAEGADRFELVAAPRTPAKKACEGKYPVDPSAWEAPGWKLIQFAMQDPHYYQYELVVAGDTITAVAHGDLDCDGVESRFEQEGRLIGGRVEFQPMRVTNELE